MIDIAALGLALCLNTGVMDCDSITYEYDATMKRQRVNGITLLYKSSGRQVIKITTEYKNDKEVLSNILIHELAHAHGQQQGGSIKSNHRHGRVFSDACKTLTTNLETTDIRVCRKEANFG